MLAGCNHIHYIGRRRSEDSGLNSAAGPRRTHAVQPNRDQISASTHLENFWFTQAVASMDCGGRIGSGFIEAHEHGTIPPWLRAGLGIDLPDALPAYASTEHAVRVPAETGNR